MRAVACAERTDHRRRVRLGEVPGLGRHRPRDAPQPALSLDAPRARVSVRRHGQAARARHRARGSTTTATAAGRSRSSRRRGCCEQYGVRVVCSTDDPADDLAPHARHARQPARLHQAVPDLAPGQGARRSTIDGLEHLGRQAGGGCRASRSIGWRVCWKRWPAATRRFTSAAVGASDHGLERIFVAPSTPRSEAQAIFAKARRAGTALDRGGDRQAALGDAPRPRRHGSRARLGAAVPPGRDAQQEQAAPCARSAPTPATTRSATARRGRRWPASSTASTAGPAREDDPLQPQPARQRGAAPR